MWLVGGLLWGVLMRFAAGLAWPTAMVAGLLWGVVSGLAFCVWMRRRMRTGRV
ncbi:hypothetical protein [Streptomyces sp. NPDC055189]